MSKLQRISKNHPALRIIGPSDGRVNETMEFEKVVKFAKKFWVLFASQKKMVLFAYSCWGVQSSERLVLVFSVS